MEFEDRPYRLKSYAWPWGKPEDKPWRPSPVIDKRDMRDPEKVGKAYLTQQEYID